MAWNITPDTPLVTLAIIFDQKLIKEVPTIISILNFAREEVFYLSLSTQ